MRTILIAGRGESAIRIARACRAEGLAGVARCTPTRWTGPLGTSGRPTGPCRWPASGTARTYLDPARLLRARTR